MTKSTRMTQSGYCSGSKIRRHCSLPVRAAPVARRALRCAALALYDARRNCRFRATLMDVAEWLRGLGFGQYATVFRDNDIDGEVLRRLTAEDLRDLGVASVGHRRRLLDA